MTGDLFGGPVGPAQFSLFDESERWLPAPVRRVTPNPAKVRAELLALLDTARMATEMPWTARDADYWQAVFPNMANWLPEKEASILRLEFAREMDRLRAG